MKPSSLHTVGLYNEVIRLSEEANDAATRTILESIVKEEDAHVDWLEEAGNWPRYGHWTAPYRNEPLTTSPLAFPVHRPIIYYRLSDD